MDIRIGFYYTDLIYSKGTIILYYDRERLCFQFLYTKEHVGNFLYVLTPIIFIMDKDRNIIASHSLVGLGEGEFDLIDGCRISCNFDNDNITLILNNEKIIFPDVELLIAKRAYIENSIKKIPSYFFYSDLKDKEFKRIKEYVDKLDIDEILSSLEVSISEHFRNKIGGDDSYYVDRSTSSSSGIVQTDPYLNSFLKIGKHNIYSDSGYTSAYNMAIPGLKTGLLEGDDLQKYLKELKSSYSKERHIYELVNVWIGQNVIQNMRNKEKLCNILYQIDFEFTNVYHLKFYRTGYLDTYGVTFTCLNRKEHFFEADKGMRSYERMSERIKHINSIIYDYYKNLNMLNYKFSNELRILQQ